MKRVIRLFLAIVILVISMGATTSCRNASKYVDDIWRAVDDKIDDGVRIKPPRKPIKQQQCNQCNGSGRVFNPYDGIVYECDKCGGDGKVIFN